MYRIDAWGWRSCRCLLLVLLATSVLALWPVHRVLASWGEVAGPVATDTITIKIGQWPSD